MDSRELTRFSNKWQTTDMPANSNADHVTKSDLQSAVQQLERRLDEAVATMKTVAESSNRETIRHFDVALENIVEETRGANHDMLELLRDKQLEHEERISVLEHGRIM